MKCGFKDKAWQSGTTGMAGNLRVASELMLRGFSVSVPYVDNGVDLYVNGLLRIQVKSAHVYKRGQGQPSYVFALGRGPKARGGGIATKSTPRIFSEQCHFVVLWGIEQHRFWVVPANLLDGRMTIYLGPEGRWIATDAERIKVMLESGMTQRDIAKELGVSEMTVSRRVNKMFTKPCDTIAALMRIRECEGRWDYIRQYLDTMNEADRVVEAQTPPFVLTDEGE